MCIYISIVVLVSNDSSQNNNTFQICLYAQKVNSPQFMLFTIAGTSKITCTSIYKKGIPLNL